MPFDVRGALKSGYSLEEVGSHLNFNVKAARSSNYSDDEIISYLERADAKTPSADLKRQEKSRPFLDRLIHPTGRGAANYPDMPVSEEERKKAIKNTGKFALEAGMTGLMGTAGTSFGGPGAGIPLAGIGYSAAKQIENFFAGNKESAMTPENMVTGSAMEAGGQILGKAVPLVKRGYNALKQIYENGFLPSNLSPEALKRLALSRETGVVMSPANVTGKKADALVESQLGKNIGSANKAQEFANTQLKSAEEYAGRIQDKTFGGREDTLSAGQRFKEASWERYNKFRENLSKIYNKIPIAKGQAIQTSRLAEVATDHLDELGKLESPTIKRVLGVAKNETDIVPAAQSSILDASGKPIITKEVEKIPAYTWETLLRDQQVLRRMQHSTGDYNAKRIYGNLIDAIDDDIAEYAANSNNPAIKSKLDAAVKYARGGAKSGLNRLPGYEVWRNRQISNAMRKSDPEDIVNNFMKASDNRTDIQRLKDAAGIKGFQAIKQAWLRKGLTSGTEGQMSPSRFISWYDAYKRGGNLDVILSKSERAALDKLYDVNKILLEAEKLAGNPSGTAQTLINSGLSWMRHPVRMTILQMGAKNFADKYFSDKAFQALVAKGLGSKPSSREASTIAKQLAIMAGVGMAQDKD